MAIREELEAFYRSIVPHLQADARAGETMPKAFVFEEKGKMDLLATPFGNEHEKRLMTKTIDAFCAERRARGLIFISEVWTACTTIPKGETLDEVRRDLPDDLSEAPGSKEAVMALLLTHGWCANYKFEIMRDKSGKVVGFGPEEKMEGEKVEQRMFDYFCRYAI
jgi:hypothetical protein